MIHGEKSLIDAQKHFEKLALKYDTASERQKLYMDVSNKFDIDIQKLDDMVTFKRNIGEYNLFNLFAVLYFMDRDCLPKYFTEDEIKHFSTETEHEEKVAFPLVFPNMVQVTEDQWIGATTAQTLMKLRDAQLINYKENAQRLYKYVKAGSAEVRKININQSNVNEIADRMARQRYIPDDITLNMPLGESDFSFSDGVLTIYSLPDGKLDITDGFHRWLGMSKDYILDTNFDYPMELRITNHSQEIVEQFIDQKNKKTPMRKMDADTFNQYSIPNRVAKMLNTDPNSYINGMIGRQRTDKISMQIFSLLVYKLFLPRNIKANEETQIALQIKANLMRKFNNLIEQDSTYLNRQFDERLLIIVMYVFSTDEELQNHVGLINYLYDYTANKGDLFKVYRSIRQKSINILEEGKESWRKDHAGKKNI